MSSLHADVIRNKPLGAANAGWRSDVFEAGSTESIAFGLLHDSNRFPGDEIDRILFSLPSGYTATRDDVTKAADGAYRVENVRRR